MKLFGSLPALPGMMSGKVFSIYLGRPGGVSLAE